MSIKEISRVHIGKGKMVMYKCNVCGYVGHMKSNHFNEGIGCPVCAGKTVLRGFNDMWTTAPEIAKYLSDSEQGYLFTKGSSKQQAFKCNECGYEVRKSIASVSRRGFRCPRCSVKVSYPNRFMCALLNILNITFKREAQFVWSSKKRYDFFIYPDTIVEMHGQQHYTDRFNGKYKNVSEIDKVKRELALSNGIKNYIEINASVSDKKFMIKNILNSDLASLYDLSNIDWESIEYVANKGLLKSVVDKFNNGNTTNVISKEIGVSPDIVRNLLKTANKLGLCKYDIYSEIMKNQNLAVKKLRKKVMCVTTGDVFNSINDAAKFFGISAKSLSNCLCGRSNSTGSNIGKKLKWNYVPESRGK